MKKNLALSILTGLLFALSLPPFKTGVLAYVALIPFFILLEEKSLKEAFRWGYVTGLFVDIGSLFWIGWVTLPGCIGALLILPFFVALYALLHTFLVQRLSLLAYFFSPFLWSSIEYLQSFGETAFPWNLLGYSQSYYIRLIQYAEYTSVYGVSFWVVTLNVLLFLFYKKTPYLKMRVILSGLILLWILTPLIHGSLILRDTDSKNKTIKIALLQGNIDPFEKWEENQEEKNFQIYEDLIRKTLPDNPDIVVLPETAMPFYLRYETSYLRRLRFLADSIQIPILTGTLDFKYQEENRYSYFNAAMLIEPFSLRLQHYSKFKLVPFSERVPYKNMFPFNLLKHALYDMALGIGDFSRGKEYTIFTVKEKSEKKTIIEDGTPNRQYTFSCPICFESVFPNFVRNFVHNGVDFLTIITNDAWFGKTSAPFQHTQIAAFRSIENRISIARCANTGISCFIDPYGRVSQRTGLFKEAAIVSDIALRHSTTFYTRYGDVFAQFFSVITILALLFAILKNKRKTALSDLKKNDQLKFSD